MSSMLEQAIVDAEQLKETAKKTAEETVVEKYQDEIKEAVEKILEQEEELEEEAEMTATPEGDLEFVEGLPSAQVTEEGEIVEINLDKLEEMMAEEMENGGLDASEMASREEIAEDLTEDEDVELEESDLLELTEEDLEEEIDLDEENLAAVIAEMLGATAEELEETEEVVEEDLEESNAGKTTAKKARTEKKPATMKDLDKDAKTRETDWSKKIKKESMQLTRKNKSLLREQTNLNSKAQLLEEKLNKYGTVIKKLKNKLNESNLTNAKLLYQNRILNSVSLNERQRDKIVEAISNATTVEEAKLIFETLQSAVGSFKKKKMPESLNEVVSRSSSAFIPRKEVQPKVDVFSERMKQLAGLK
jgi:hypothetical protein